MKNPRPRPIGGLLQEHFFIPRYQRGYRWGYQEVTDLLNDLRQYTQKANSEDSNMRAGKFYCLQPIVVKKKQWKNSEGHDIEGWELIDGQQRLTTLYIILSYLEDVRQYYDNSKQIYSLDFETRDGCAEFFNEKKFMKAIDTSNVDFFHISKAFKIIEEWFKDKLVERLEILKTILQNTKNTSVIWYETSPDMQLENEEEASIELFTRLNDGKIPLTDAELIKALILQSDLYPTHKKELIKQRLFEIASEWDDIEATLQDDKFWFFLNESNYEPSTRIEFIFKILADDWNNFKNPVLTEYGDEFENIKIFRDSRLVEYKDEHDKPKNFEYLVFDRYLTMCRAKQKDSKSDQQFTIRPVNDIWKEIKTLISKINEWYNDHKLYHYIGYLFAMPNVNKVALLKELIELKLPKSIFLEHIKILIKNHVEIKSMHPNSSDTKKLNEIRYGEDNTSLIKILLLFNIETLVEFKKENARFPFHLYKKEKISSLEHIHPQNPDDIDIDSTRCNIWLVAHKSTLEYLEIEDIPTAESINKLIVRIDEQLITFDKDQFKTLYSEVIELYTNIVGFKENEIHTLYNLAIVDKDTNSSLNNSFFDVKREILKDDKIKKYIPICTQRAFSKYYSKSPKEMIFWSENDRIEYFNQIEKIYYSFTNLESLNGK